MSFFKRNWTDLEKWVMGIIATLVATAIIAFVSMERGSVLLNVARSIDPAGRCIDKELFIINETETDAIDISISFGVDYFTNNGDVAINYGDEKEQMITSVMPTLLRRLPFIPIKHDLDEDNSELSIPRLKPKQYLHYYTKGDTIYNYENEKKRAALIEKVTEGLMNVPQAKHASMKDGTIEINVITNCR